MANDTWANRHDGPREGSWQASAAMLFSSDGPKPAYILQTNDVSAFDLGQAPSNTDRHETESDVENEADMNAQDRYIDARLAGIEKDVASAEKRMASAVRSIYRQNRDAEARFERTSERFSNDLGRLSEATEGVKKHVTNTAWAIGAVLVATLAIVIGVFSYWISEQGSYAKSYGENQVQMQQAADERAEFREAVKSIQATQQSILERLPPAEQSPSSQ